MKQSILKRALLTACLGVSMASVAMAGPVGPVVIPQAGDVVVINHGPDMTFTGNINFDVESQTNNNFPKAIMFDYHFRIDCGELIVSVL